MPQELDDLIAMVIERIDELTSELRDSAFVSIDRWQADMANVLVSAHLAAWEIGTGRPPDDQERKILAQIIGDQIDYLNAFADEIDLDRWTKRYEARARLYAGALKHTYWRALSGSFVLPAYPGDGSTECRTNCRCEWRIEDRGAWVDAYWVRHASDSCRTCIERESIWSPLLVWKS